MINHTPCLISEHENTIMVLCHNITQMIYPVILSFLVGPKNLLHQSLFFHYRPRVIIAFNLIATISRSSTCAVSNRDLQRLPNMLNGTDLQFRLRLLSGGIFGRFLLAVREICRNSSITCVSISMSNSAILFSVPFSRHLQRFHVRATGR